MLIKLKTFNNAIIFCSLLLFATSCKKENNPKVNVTISGRAYIKPNYKPLANVYIDVGWYDQNCRGCFPAIAIVSGKTDPDGKFSFNASIDTTHFRTYSLYVSADLVDHYFSNRNMVFFNQFDENAWKNVNFEYYSKTYLTIRTRRTLTDNFDQFTAAYSFDRDYDFQPVSKISSPANATNTDHTVFTASDAYTRIRWTKSINGVTTVKTDSVFCPANATAVFDINY